jgi:predicted transcriptional regulator
MSHIDELIEKKIAESGAFAKEYGREKERLQVAVALMKLRESEGLTQRQLAEKAGKPQSTIARIENGAMNVTFGTLNEIAASLGKTVEVHFI